LEAIMALYEFRLLDADGKVTATKQASLACRTDDNVGLSLAFAG